MATRWADIRRGKLSPEQVARLELLATLDELDDVVFRLRRVGFETHRAFDNSICTVQQQISALKRRLNAEA